MIAFISAAVLGFAITALLGYIVIPFLHKLKFGQTILDIGPKWHKSKNGTPTMGGIMMAVGFVVSFAVSVGISCVGDNSLFANSQQAALAFAAVGLAIGMGLIGFLDDYIKVVKKRNLGLTAKQKTAFQIFISAGYLACIALAGVNTTWLPFVGDIPVTTGFGLVFWPIALMFIYGFTNAVNLTDGIDGLASSVTLVVCCGFMMAAAFSGNTGCNILSCTGAGVCLGFLVWNSHPAKVFMGDTGSMFLGGLTVGIAFTLGRPILLIAAGIVYLVEAFSVMLQVAYYKKTKKRLFRMAPIHHHFEMGGYSEEKIVLLFSAVTAVGCVIALLPYII